MSRAYRIKVKESLKSTISADDEAKCKLDIIQVLPPEQMQQMLEGALAEKGYIQDGKVMKKTLDNGMEVSIDTETGEVTVLVHDCEEVEVEKTKEGYGESRQDDQHLREQVKKELAQEVIAKEKKLQQEITDKLEKELQGLKHELDQVVNRTTAEALKVKAKQLGQIKELTEDVEAGSMTIVVEV